MVAVIVEAAGSAVVVGGGGSDGGRGGGGGGGGGDDVGNKTSLILEFSSFLNAFLRGSCLVMAVGSPRVIPPASHASSRNFRPTPSFVTCDTSGGLSPLPLPLPSPPLRSSPSSLHFHLQCTASAPSPSPPRT